MIDRYIHLKYLAFYLPRIKKIADSGDVLVLYHFVKIIGSSSAEACCVYRRFIQQVSGTLN